MSSREQSRRRKDGGAPKSPHGEGTPDGDIPSQDHSRASIDSWLLVVDGDEDSDAADADAGSESGTVRTPFSPITESVRKVGRISDSNCTVDASFIIGRPCGSGRFISRTYSFSGYGERGSKYSTT